MARLTVSKLARLTIPFDGAAIAHISLVLEGQTRRDRYKDTDSATGRVVLRYHGSPLRTALPRILSGRPARSSARDATSRPNRARALERTFLAHLRRLPNYFGRDQFALPISGIASFLSAHRPPPPRVLSRTIWGGGFLIFDIVEFRSVWETAEYALFCIFISKFFN